MKFVLVGTGSAGDLVPCLRLAGALARRGYQPTVIALEDYAPRQRFDFPVHTIPGGEDSLWPRPRVLRKVSLANPGAMYLAMRRKLAQLAPRVNDALLELVDADTTLVSNSVTMVAGRLLAYARGARHASLLFAPLLPTPNSASCVFVPPAIRGRTGTAIAHLMWALTQELGGACAEDLRCRLDMVDPAGPDHGPLVMATSPFVTPHSGHWPGNVVQTGWFRSARDDRSPLPASLALFLRRHPEPLLMSFGSVLVRDPVADLALFRAATPPGRGLVVQSRALPPGPWGDTAYNALGLDHTALLPHVAQVVHHGGAGTTYAALAAGKPALVIPHLGDQAYYGRRVHALRAGPRPLPRARLSARKLRAAVRRLDDPAYAAGAGVAQRILAREDGIAHAVQVLERT
ncbi:glycosyltransferase [Granulicoccus sp. GXG6511]|uniref:glycosyltransferase n=1 Tax=Granulicoccus sp. GXG6511 TaxID=3381351 RepID=UPI003D7E3C43